jgi:hypothetical protein
MTGPLRILEKGDCAAGKKRKPGLAGSWYEEGKTCPLRLQLKCRAPYRVICRSE